MASVTDQLTYAPETGVFTWKRTGRTAGCRRADGYRVIRVDGRLRYGHRLAFVLIGLPEPRFVDHIDGDPSNNCWGNLRVATHAQNMANARGKSSHQSSRYKGVTWHKQRGKWAARITTDWRSLHLGLFDDETAAARAYNAAAARHFGDFARLNEVGNDLNS
jgi:hypothetical protein